jgi:hypothetical protein
MTTMYEAELRAYCEKHGWLEVVEQYTTYGEERGPHHRAIVRDTQTGERYYLYYDSSRRRRTWAQQKADLDRFHDDPYYTLPRRARGWRNTTLDNRRRAARYNNRYLEQEQAADVGT